MTEEIKQNTEIIASDVPAEAVPKKNTQGRDWCFTVNNPVQTESEFSAYLESLKESDDLRYAVFQREKAPDTGTEHYQGYFEFSQPKWFTTIRNLLSEKAIGVQAHVQQRRKKRSQAREYCMDDETRVSPQYYEIGKFIEDGGRTDLGDIADDIEGGMTNMELARKYGNRYVAVRAWADEYRQDYLTKKYSKDRRVDIEVIYICGGTGAGKTRYVLDKYGDENVFIASDYGNKFTKERFDGYKGEKIILFDEFRSSISMTNMYRYLDVYKVQLPCRYNNKTACYNKVFITSNWKLEEQYKTVQTEHPEDWKAFLRRLTAVYDFDKSKDVPIDVNLWYPFKGVHKQEKITVACLRPLSQAEQDELPF